MAMRATIQASSNPAELSGWDELAVVALSWTCDKHLTVEIHVDAPDGPLLSRTGGSGTTTTGKWVQDGTTFYLQDVSDGKPLTAAHTLAQTSVGVITLAPVPRAVILMYHRVADDPSYPREQCVTPWHFQEHLAALSAGRRVISLEELLQARAAGRIPHGSVVLTFDDGYADNFLAAKPLLDEYEAPAAFFITSGYLGHQRGFWWDELRDVLSGNAPADPERYLTFARSLDPLDHLERRERLDMLRRQFGCPPPLPSGCRPLSAEELLAMADGPLVTIGSHTETHPSLAGLPEGQQLLEIQQSKQTLEKLLGRPVLHFAYPGGSCGPGTPGLLQSAGLVSACLASGGVVTAATDPFQLPRMQVCDWNGAEFSRRLVRWLGTNP